jgi:hypothetical protein
MNDTELTVPDFLMGPCFWTENLAGAHEKIMPVESIEYFNNRITEKLPAVKKLQTLKDNISGEIVAEYIKDYTLPSEDMYTIKGEKFSSAFLNGIVSNTDVEGVGEWVRVKYGITTKKASLRSFPDETPVFSSIKDSRFNNMDRFQQTGCEPFEPVIILHESKDSEWLFVRIYNYAGWTKRENIAVGESKNQVFDYIDSKEFLVVTDRQLLLKVPSEGGALNEILCGMGTKMPLIKSTSIWSVKIPRRDIKGNLKFTTAFLEKSKAVCEGYLPYTRYNIINQAFKFLNEKYEWGDKNSGKDCSSFIMTVYKTFGFRLPRNAGEQENCSDITFKFKKASLLSNEYNSRETRRLMLSAIKPGTVLFMNGHVMMYLGKHNDKHYMIHNFAAYGEKDGSNIKYCPAYKVAVTSVDLLTPEGVPYLDKLTSAVQFEL